MSLMTKRALAASLKKLMSTKPLSKITVKHVVDDCGVNRQTFYYHFQDIYDLIGWIYKTEAMEAIADNKTYETWQQGFLRIFYYVRDNRDFCMNSMYSLGRDHLDSFLYSNTFDLLIGVVNEVAEGMNVSIEDREFVANFFTYAFVALVIMWMKQGMTESPESIIDRLNKLVEGEMLRALKKYEQNT